MGNAIAIPGRISNKPITSDDSQIWPHFLSFQTAEGASGWCGAVAQKVDRLCLFEGCDEIFVLQQGEGGWRLVGISRRDYEWEPKEQVDRAWDQLESEMSQTEVCDIWLL